LTDPPAFVLLAARAGSNSMPCAHREKGVILSPAAPILIVQNFPMPFPAAAIAKAAIQ